MYKHYINRSLKELKQLAKQRGLIGYSTLNKDDLITVLQRKSKILNKKECKSQLSKKISKNIKDVSRPDANRSAPTFGNRLKKKKYKSNKQAIAVAYSQVKKKYPECKRVLA